MPIQSILPFGLLAIKTLKRHQKSMKYKILNLWILASSSICYAGYAETMILKSCNPYHHNLINPSLCPTGYQTPLKASKIHDSLLPPRMIKRACSTSSCTPPLNILWSISFPSHGPWHVSTCGEDCRRCLPFLISPHLSSLQTDF